MSIHPITHRFIPENLHDSRKETIKDKHGNEQLVEKGIKKHGTVRGFLRSIAGFAFSVKVGGSTYYLNSESARHFLESNNQKIPSNLKKWHDEKDIKRLKANNLSEIFQGIINLKPAPDLPPPKPLEPEDQTDLGGQIDQPGKEPSDGEPSPGQSTDQPIITEPPAGNTLPGQPVDQPRVEPPVEPVKQPSQKPNTEPTPPVVSHPPIEPPVQKPAPNPDQRGTVPGKPAVASQPPVKEPSILPTPPQEEKEGQAAPAVSQTEDSLVQEPVQTRRRRGKKPPTDGQNPATVNPFQTTRGSKAPPLNVQVDPTLLPPASSQPPSIDTEQQDEELQHALQLSLQEEPNAEGSLFSSFGNLWNSFFFSREDALRDIQALKTQLGQDLLTEELAVEMPNEALSSMLSDLKMEIENRAHQAGHTSIKENEKKKNKPIISSPIDMRNEELIKETDPRVQRAQGAFNQNVGNIDEDSSPIADKFDLVEVKDDGNCLFYTLGAGIMEALSREPINFEIIKKSFNEAQDEATHRFEKFDDRFKLIEDIHNEILKGKPFNIALSERVTEGSRTKGEELNTFLRDFISYLIVNRQNIELEDFYEGDLDVIASQLKDDKVFGTSSDFEIFGRALKIKIIPYVFQDGIIVRYPVVQNRNPQEGDLLGIHTFFLGECEGLKKSSTWVVKDSACLP